MRKRSERLAVLKRIAAQAARVSKTLGLGESYLRSTNKKSQESMKFMCIKLILILRQIGIRAFSQNVGGVAIQMSASSN